VETCRKAGAARLPADVRMRARARIATLLATGPSGRPRTGFEDRGACPVRRMPP
jgi:hypothetical protein